MTEADDTDEDVIHIKLDISTLKIDELTQRAEGLMDKLDQQAEQGGPLASLLAGLMLEPDKSVTRGELARVVEAVWRAIVPRS